MSLYSNEILKDGQIRELAIGFGVLAALDEGEPRQFFEPFVLGGEQVRRNRTLNKFDKIGRRRGTLAADLDPFQVIVNRIGSVEQLDYSGFIPGGAYEAVSVDIAR